MRANRQRVTRELEESFGKLGASKSQSDAVAESFAQGGGAPPGAESGGAKAQAFIDAVHTSFAESVQTVFYGMAAAMALAFLVALVGVPAGKAPDVDIEE